MKSFNVSMRTASFLLALILAHPTSVSADDNKAVKDHEIEHLLNFVGDSGCLFVRNGKEHAPAEAESHLRMKYRKARRYISDADEFIERIASGSSWSGKPYQALCSGEAAQASSDWLQAELTRYRAAKTP